MTGCNSLGNSVEGAIQTRQLLATLPMLALLASPIFATTNIIEIFERCDPVDKAIVVGLGVFSLIAWTIMFGKHFELKRLQLLNHSFEVHLRDQRTLLDLPESLRNKRGIPYADLFADAVESYWRAAAIGKERGVENSRARLEHAENALQRALARQTLRYESSMIFLASIVSGAPFIGLLGTVWGVMEAFQFGRDAKNRRHSAARSRRIGRDARHNRGPGRGDSVGLRLQSPAGQHAADDHRAGKLRELARRSDRVGVELSEG